MRKQTFKMVNEDENIFDIGGLKIQVINNKEYKFSDSFKPNIYKYEIINHSGEVISSYIGKSLCGSSSRFCDHLTHNTLRIDKEIEKAKENNYLIRIEVIDIVNSIAEMNIKEERRIHELCKNKYKEITNEETNYSSYNNFKEILSNKILNDMLF